MNWPASRVAVGGGDDNIEIDLKEICHKFRR
jgi:hypothetical protein